MCLNPYAHPNPPPQARRWPSKRFLKFALTESEAFPALQRWILERESAWRAIRWADRKLRSDQDPEESDGQSSDDETEEKAPRDPVRRKGNHVQSRDESVLVAWFYFSM